MSYISFNFRLWTWTCSSRYFFDIVFFIFRSGFISLYLSQKINIMGNKSEWLSVILLQQYWRTLWFLMLLYWTFVLFIWKKSRFLNDKLFLTVKGQNWNTLCNKSHLYNSFVGQPFLCWLDALYCWKVALPHGGAPKHAGHGQWKIPQQQEQGAWWWSPEYNTFLIPVIDPWKHSTAQVLCRLYPLETVTRVHLCSCLDERESVSKFGDMDE